MSVQSRERENHTTNHNQCNKFGDVAFELFTAPSGMASAVIVGVGGQRSHMPKYIEILYLTL